MVDRFNNTYRSRYYSEISHYSNHPSFSSSLLDSIYRSIDLGEEDKMGIYRDLPNCVTTKKKKQDHRAANMRPVFNTDEEMANFQRACMIEKWMEKKVTTEKIAVKKSRKDRKNFSSSSSDSSCNDDGGGFFSSAAAVHKPKPVRTGCPASNHRESETNRRRGDQLPIKSRALKIYGELKKAKQPISPGGKVAAFLNSLFAAANLKKPKNGANCSDDYPVSLKSTNTSSCSSASSFSRSCLSKTPSSRGKSEKRTVRFFVDDDKSENNNNDNNNNISCIKTAINEELMLHIMENNRGVDIDLLKNYQKNNQQQQQQCDQFDDAESYASSDLFELENLSAIGMERYTEELPVYETTHLHTNRAIANGFIL